jgi:hypothetical protein
MTSNRPLRRILIRLAWRLIGGRRRAHFHEWFPWLDIEPATGSAGGVIRYHARIVAPAAQLKSLTDRASEEVFVIGSGPSLRDQDLSLLPDRSALLLNGAISLIGGPIREPLAVVMEDERFVWRNFRDIVAKIPAETVMILSVEVIRAMCEIDPAWLADKRIIPLFDRRKPMRGPLLSMEDLRGRGTVILSDDETAGFSSAPEMGVFKAGSVAVSAMQFALACRPRRVGLLGVDISNAVAGAQRFNESEGNVAFTGVARAQDKIIAHLSLAREIATRQGIEVLNYSPVSALRAAGFGYDPRFALETPPSA